MRPFREGDKVEYEIFRREEIGYNDLPYYWPVR